MHCNPHFGHDFVDFVRHSLNRHLFVRGFVFLDPSLSWQKVQRPEYVVNLDEAAGILLGLLVQDFSEKAEAAIDLGVVSPEEVETSVFLNTVLVVKLSRYSGFVGRNDIELVVQVVPRRRVYAGFECPCGRRACWCGIRLCNRKPLWWF